MRSLLCSCLAVLLLSLSSPAEAASRPLFKHWHNQEGTLHITYPDLFWSSRLSSSGEELILYSANGETELRLHRQPNSGAQDAARCLAEAKASLAHIVPDSEALGDNWYSITVSDDGGQRGLEHHTLQYGLVTEKSLCSFSFRYRADDPDITPEMLEIMKKSLHAADLPADILPAGQFSGSEAPFILAEDARHFCLRKADGSAGTPCGELLPQEEESGWQCFTVSEDTPQARPSDYGLWFCNLFDGSMAFLPTDSAAYIGSVRISPSGSYFLVDYGTSPLRDLQLYDFRTMQKKASFLAMEKIAWIDESHIIFTHVPDIHSLSGERMYRCSVAQGDLEGKVILLKEATALADYFVEEVDRSKGEARITKHSVTQEQDWNDYEKQQRENFLLPLRSK